LACDLTDPGPRPLPPGDCLHDDGWENLEVAAMQWDIGWPGVGLLVVMSLGFGLVALVLAGRRRSLWLWPVAAFASLVAGLFTSEVWFGWATEEELQPNIDGVSFDEVLLMNVVLTTLIIVVARYLTRRQRERAAGSPATEKPPVDRATGVRSGAGRP
jgi:hypothetical protein